MKEKLASRNVVAFHAKRLREANGLTARAAEDLIGAKRSYWGKLEKGLVNVPVDKLDVIAEAFRVDPRELLEPPKRKKAS